MASTTRYGPFGPENVRPGGVEVVDEKPHLGFLLGPVYVGAWADAIGLRGAMVAVAALAVALVGLTVPLLRLSRGPNPAGHDSIHPCDRA